MSPHGLIQESLSRAGGLYPWRVLVACVLLNRTQGSQVRPMVMGLFRCYPTPQALAAAGKGLEFVLEPLGLGHRRAETLRRLSRDYAAGKPPEECHGVGRYARDALAVFVEGRTDIEPSDKWLRPYVEWKREHGRERHEGTRPRKKGARATPARRQHGAAAG